MKVPFGQLTVTDSGEKIFKQHGVKSMQTYIKDSGAFDPEVVSAVFAQVRATTR
jgi:hypothetical protein